MDTIKRYGNIIIFICIILEMLIWPSINNFFGCLMTVIAWIIFSKIGLNEQVIKEHTFAWLVFLSMSLYRILPLMATLIEGNSIGYNLVVPLSTYCGETLLYLVSALAFYLAVKQKNTFLFLKNLLYSCGFYDRANKKTLWMLGLLGLIAEIYTTINHIEIGNVVGKIMEAFTFLQYAPVLIFFPKLMGVDGKSEFVILNKSGIIYIIFLIALSFAANSREALLEPVGTFGLLFLLSYINSSSSVRRTLNKKNIIIGIILILFFIPMFSDISLAMIYNRQFRTDTTSTEIFIRTIETFRDKEKIEELRSLKDKKEFDEIKTATYKDWSETYVSNFALNRYCNLKVADNTLYHAKKVGYPNKYMFDDFWIEVAALLPTPILNFLKIDYDKNVRYSRGDKLKALSSNRHPFPSHLVTSHLADGLLTFGYWYFPIELFLFYIRFLFLDTFVLNCKGKTYYSVFALISIFTYFAMFRHGPGGGDSLSFVLRGYWQDVILFIVGFTLLKKISLN